MKKYSTDFKCLFALILLALPVFFVTWKYQGHFIIDVGRELFYPERILAGKVLYKDLFNIYGPYSYLYNALLYKIFCIHINTLLISGIFTALGILISLYFIARIFFESFLSFSITFFSLIICCLSFYIFNYVFPYTYAITYGLLFALISIYLLLKFSQTKDEKLYLVSAFFVGLAVACKYEFLPLGLIYFFIEWKLNFSINRFLKVVFITLIPLLLCFGILFLQGLTWEALIHNLKDLYVMITSKTLEYFYVVSGLTFQKNTLGLLLRCFIKTILPLMLFVYGMTFYKKRKILAIVICLIALFFANLRVDAFLFLPVLLFVLMCLFFKKQSFETQILSLATLLISLKVFWATPLNSYGLFFIPILLITIIKYLKPDYRESVCLFLLFWSLMNIPFGMQLKNEKLGYIKTEKGSLHISNVHSDNANKILEFMKKETKPTDRIVILPEGLLINFLADRKSDDYYNSLLPLYLETFGEQNLINHFKNTKPEYIIFHNFPTSDYYFQSICKDYGVDFCTEIKKEYLVKHLLDGAFGILILEKK